MDNPAEFTVGADELLELVAAIKAAADKDTEKTESDNVYHALTNMAHAAIKDAADNYRPEGFGGNVTCTKRVGGDWIPVGYHRIPLHVKEYWKLTGQLMKVPNNDT